MFNNLIESSSHRKEFKRRGSFFLFTVGTYILLFAITGVASIYAYDPNLGGQNFEITWLPPVNLQEDHPVSQTTSQARPPNSNNRASEIAQRVAPTVSVDDPQKVPDGISTTPNKNREIPKSGIWTYGRRDTDPIGGGNPGPAIDGSRMMKPSGPVLVDAGDPPPPEAPPKPKTVIKSRVLNSEALSLPKPIYPMIARQARVQGTVTVQILIDETGRVISAKTVSGHPLLLGESQRAALQARFSPTFVGDQAVKVSGIITYNFVMQ